jgi:hypothetical protein
MALIRNRRDLPALKLVIQTAPGAASREVSSNPCSIAPLIVTPRSRDALDLHGGAVGEDFGYALHYFGGVVAHGDNGVGAMLRGVLQ